MTDTKTHWAIQMFDPRTGWRRVSDPFESRHAAQAALDKIKPDTTARRVREIKEGV